MWIEYCSSKKQMKKTKMMVWEQVSELWFWFQILVIGVNDQTLEHCFVIFTFLEITMYLLRFWKLQLM